MNNEESSKNKCTCVGNEKNIYRMMASVSLEISCWLTCNCYNIGYYFYNCHDHENNDDDDDDMLWWWLIWGWRVCWCGDVVAGVRKYIWPCYFVFFSVVCSLVHLAVFLVTSYKILLVVIKKILCFLNQLTFHLSIFSPVLFYSSLAKRKPQRKTALLLIIILLFQKNHHRFATKFSPARCLLVNKLGIRFTHVQ